MNSRRLFFLVISGVALTAIVPVAQGAARTRKPPESDLAPVEARRAVVDTAVRLAKVEAPAALGESLPLPFNPAAYNQVAPVENHATTETTAAPASPEAPKAMSDRDILAAIAPRILPSGTFNLGGQQLLIFNKKRLKIGDRLTVTFEGRNYDLLLKDIDRTNFTLRLNQEEITRPIKPGKNP